MTKPAIERLREEVRAANNGRKSGSPYSQAEIEMGVRLLRRISLDAEGEREAGARVIDPDAFDIAGERDDTADRLHRRGRALRTADAILQRFAALALGEEAPR